MKIKSTIFILLLLGMNQGLTHFFSLTFAFDKDRNAYLVHPAHKEFGKSLGTDVEKVMVFDFWVK